DGQGGRAQPDGPGRTGGAGDPTETLGLRTLDGGSTWHGAGNGHTGGSGHSSSAGQR
ncbi:hypothetical protein G3I76_19405, partial [Streptomyces sp. SID11233]|nr:hypothetical protein [Streptomyces sp. SID11233]